MAIFSLSDLKLQYDQTVIPQTDPRSRDWPFVTCYPIVISAIILIYLIIVKVGPQFMKNRQPYQIRSFLVIYNFVLVLASLYMAIEMFLSYKHARYQFTCSTYNRDTWKNPKEFRMATVLWWYYISKFIELFDTFAMILKKKESQITWLHLIHHVSIIIMCWMMVVFFPGGLMWFGCWLNCMVHVFMYSYYGLSAIPAYKSRVHRWKQYITRMQLTQFTLVVLHLGLHIWNKCDFPNWGKYTQLGYTFMLMILFVNFYTQAYLKKKNIAMTEKHTYKNDEAYRERSLPQNGKGDLRYRNV